MQISNFLSVIRRAVWLTLCLTVGVPASHALTLSEAYNSALKHRPIVVTSALDEKIARANRLKAISRVLPKFSGTSESRWLDTVQLSGDTSRFSQSYQHTARLSFTQPVFQGGSEYYGLSITRSAVNIAEHEKRQVQLDLFDQVAGQFFDLLILQLDRDSLTRQKEILEKRVAFLEGRERIGRSKLSDLLSAQAQLARVNAQLSQTLSQEKALEENFLWLTGLDQVGILTSPYDDQPMAVDPSWESLVLESPEIKARELELRNAEKEVRVAQGGYLPNVDFGGNYYLDRSGILTGSDWDLTLLATWEFFSGFGTRAEAQIQKFELQKMELNVSDLKKQRVADFNSLHKRLEQQKSTVEKLKIAEDLAKKNYLERQREYERGLIDNLDVLDALDDHLVIQSALDRERSSAQLTWIRLQLLAGNIP